MESYRLGDPTVGYPLRYLPANARSSIAHYFDSDKFRFEQLAELLGYDHLPAAALWNQGFQGPENSATRKLLTDCEQRGLTIPLLYQAFMAMNHAAAHVILEYLPEIHYLYQSAIQRRLNQHPAAVHPQPSSNYPGQENSCYCDECLSARLRHVNSDSSRNNQPQGRVQTFQRHNWIPPENLREYPRVIPGSSNPSSQRVPNPIPDSVPSHVVPEPARSVRNRARGTCQCESCRLASDPNETQLLTVPGSRKEDCLVEEMANMGISEGGQGHFHSNGVSVGDRRDSGSVTRSGGDMSFNGARPKTPRRCSSSMHGAHYLGACPDTCAMCRNSLTATELRHSWHGSEGGSREGSVKDFFSDNSLNGKHDPEIIYSRTNNLNDMHSVDKLPAKARPMSDNINIHSVDKLPAKARPMSDNTKGGCYPSASNNESSSTSSSNPKTNSKNNASKPATKNETARQQSKETPSTYNSENHGTPRKTVFMTCSPHNNRHLEEIKKLIRIFQDAGIRVKIDMSPDCFDELCLNRNEWLDRSIDGADYVVICISPTYYLDVCTEHNPTDPNPRISQLNAHYIYDRLRAEYINNQSQNRRMIPILFRNSGAQYRPHTPPIMQATLVYTYPDNVEAILDRILGIKDDSLSSNAGALD